MGNVYNGQSLLKIELDTKVNVSTATTKRIKYTKPSGTEGTADGYYTALLDADNTTLYYEFQSGDIDEAGIWTFWPYVVIGGRVADGDRIKKKFYVPGTFKIS